jgi:hypothetical protein
MFKWLKKLIPRKGPKKVTFKEMEKFADYIQEEFDLPEDAIPELFRNANPEERRKENDGTEQKRQSKKESDLDR